MAIPQGNLQLSDKAKMIIIIIVIVLVLVFAGYWLSKTFGSIGTIFSKIGDTVGDITDGLGITTPKAVQDAEAAAVAANLTSSNVNSPFSPQFYTTAGNGAVLNPTENGGAGMSTTDVATQIWQAAGFFTTDGQSMLAAFKALSTQAQISYLAYIFNSMYSKDLYDFISSQLQSNNNKLILQQILTWVSSLPQY